MFIVINEFKRRIMKGISTNIKLIQKSVLSLSIPKVMQSGMKNKLQTVKRITRTFSKKIRLLSGSNTSILDSRK